MKTATKKGLSPRTARTHAEITRLRRDHVSTPKFWLQLDMGEITIARQRNGEPAETTITIPKRDFNRLVDFYCRERERGAPLGARPLEL